MTSDSPLHGIGTLREKSLHAALKTWAARPGDQIEVPVAGYHIDIVRGDLLIEIQTRNFSAIKPKLTTLLDSHRIRLIHPIPVQRWLVDLDAEAKRQIRRRKSPKRGRVEDIFSELVRIPKLMIHPNLSIDVLLIHDEEIRRDDGKGSWRRKGRSIYDRRLLAVIEHIPFATPADFGALLPTDLPDTFTTGDLKSSLSLTPRLAGKMAYCLKHMGVIEQCGKRGRAYLYHLTRK